MGGKKGGGEVEWARALKLGSGELLLEQRSSCNPLGAVSSWLNWSRSHRKRPLQEGRRGLEQAEVGRSPRHQASGRLGPEESETESALTGLVPVLLQPSELGDASQALHRHCPGRASPPPPVCNGHYRLHPPPPGQWAPSPHYFRVLLAGKFAS